MKNQITYNEDEIREAEEFLLGGLLVQPNLVDEAISIVGTDTGAFRAKEMQSIYASILSCYEKGEDINPLTVWIGIEQLELTETVMGGASFIRDLYARIVETESTLSYAKVVKASHDEHKQKAAALRIAASPAVDKAILDEASRIEADRTSESVPDTEATVEFPESLLVGIFGDYVDAYKGATEVSPSLLFGTLKTIIGSTLGRRVSLDGTTPLYPNFYSTVVGHTGLARKSTALSLAENIIEQADPTVFILRSLSTPEGLMQVFVPPDGYELGSALPVGEVDETKTSVMDDNIGDMLVAAEKGVEGFRILLSIDEFSHLLKKAGKTHGDGLIQMLATAYNYPVKMHLPTRVSPLSADRPCLTAIGATTLQWLESSLKLEDIQGGFANRITYYLSEPTEYIALDRPGDQTLLDKVVYAVKDLRYRYPRNVRFRFDDVARSEFQTWYESHRKALEQEANPMVVLASVRADVHAKKAALLFSALRDPDDHFVHKPALDWAITLTDYLQKVVTHIYSNFNFSETRRLESRIIELVTKTPNMTARELTQRISWASAKDVNAACRELVENGTLREEPTKWTTRFYVARA